MMATLTPAPIMLVAKQAGTLAAIGFQDGALLHGVDPIGSTTSTLGWDLATRRVWRAHGCTAPPMMLACV